MATELLENPVIQVSGTATIGPNVEVANLCEIKESQVVTTSLRVAEIFERKHKTVLQAIRELDCSDGFRGQNFLPTLKTTQLPNNATRQDPFYFITIEGFQTMRTHCTGLPDDVAAEVITAFHRAKGKNRPGQPNAVTPKPTHGRQKADGRPKRQAAAPSLPTDPADMMQRFMKAMGVMMGMDVNEITNLMNGGGK